VVRLTHVLVGACILGAFFVMSISAWYLLRKRHEDFARRSFTVACAFGALFSIAALASGDSHAKVVATHQPAKLAAMEGHFHTGTGGAEIHVFGWPDEDAREVRFPIAIPGGLSFLVHGDLTTPVPGLDSFPREDWPPVLVPFLAFHVMVGLGSLFLVMTLGGLVLLWRRTLFSNRLVLWAYVPMVLLTYVANQAGWIAAEVGRQPWTVYGLLRTADSVSKSVKGGQVLTSIIGFGLVYALLFVVWLSVMNDKVQHGPDDGTQVEAHGDDGNQAGSAGLASVAADKVDPSRGSMLG